jgi:hypothetical protein
VNRRDYETTYELAYDMGRVDAEAGFAAACDQSDWPWYSDDVYTEGYGDGWADAAERLTR